MADETDREMNEVRCACAKGRGWVVAARLLDEDDTASGSRTPGLGALGAYRLGVPVTVHAALGAEIIHQHPAANGAAISDTSHRDFRRLAHSLRLSTMVVALNLGSAVIMPRCSSRR
jgi:hypothetical protein